MYSARTLPPASRWLVPLHPQRPGGPAGPRLICLPHAGGSASYYLPLAARLSADFDVYGVQYPGRQSRRDEPPVTDPDELVARIAEALLPGTDRPTVLFGHSMGALLAYEAARLLWRYTGRPPAALVVSGRAAPGSHPSPAPSSRDKGDDELIEEIRKLGGTAASLQADDELMRLFLPAIRADYRIVETYRHRPGPPLDCPLTALTGAGDPRVTGAQAQAWAAFTSRAFAVRTFPGGHFYLSEQWDAVAAAIESA